MIAGDQATDGKVFEKLRFNDKHPDTNPVTGQPLSSTPFWSETLGFSELPEGEPLPRLHLDRVFVITGSNTCSASESIINGLRGVDVEVIQIGGTTCGKPYGYYPQDNCGTTYAMTQFQGENHKGFGDYGDGFAPEGSSGSGATLLPGCAVTDDLTHELGDPREERLAAALRYRSEGSCTEPATGIMSSRTESAQPTDGVVPKSPVLQNKIMRGEQ